MTSAVSGHLWTVGMHLWDTVRPPPRALDEPWSHIVRDDRMGEVKLTGHLRRNSSTLMLVIHGLGGDAQSRYVLRTAAAAEARGHSYFRYNMRGADHSGEDIYHAGLTSDLRAALSSPALADFDQIVIIGWSLGGHLALRWAAEDDRDPRVRAVIAVCAPLDLDYGARSIQRTFGRPYQWHVLRSLKDKYRPVAARRAVPTTAAACERIETLIEWDDRIVVPRFGFQSRQQYYADTSAGPSLHRIELPTLFIAADHDPMVTADQLHRWLPHASPMVRPFWTGRGGHVGFPSDLDLGVGAPGAIEPQLLRWAVDPR